VVSAVRFELATPGRIVFGPGALAELGGVAADLGRRALLVTGRTASRADAAREALSAAGVATVGFAVAGEPAVGDVRRGADAARAEGVDLVVACGGGSAIDCGKAIAALLGNGGDPLDYLEVVGRGRPLTRPSLPFVAIPTTAGTGSEVTRNAVLASPEHRVKASLRSPSMLARAAIVDPDLLLGLPPHVVAASGLDAFAQLVEPFLSVRANPLVDSLCREGLARSARSLRRAFEGDASEPVRVDLALASLFGGLALANAGLGAVHGFAAPAGGLFDAPHGAACAALLPAVLRVNLAALSRRRPASPALARYREIAAIVTGRPDAGAADAVAWTESLARALGVPGLSRWGAAESDVPALVAKARAASSMKGNPVELEEDELVEIARASL
jgi:alcohol dehydrogenase class IV